MEIDQLRALVSVAARGSLTRAAEELGVTQPAVSIRLKTLERRLGVRLLDTSAGKVRLTDAGEVLLAEGKKVLRQLEIAHEAVESVGGLLRGRIAVGASTTPGIYFVSEVLARFSLERPGVSVSLRIDNTLRVEEALLGGDLDLGVVGGHLAGREVASESLGKDRIVLVAPPGHRLARGRPPHLEEVLQQPFVAREPGSATRSHFESWLARQGLAARVVLEVGSPEALKRAVAAGAGLGVVSAMAVRSELRQGRLTWIRPAGFDLRRDIRLILRKGGPGSRAVGAVRDRLRASWPRERASASGPDS